MVGEMAKKLPNPPSPFLLGKNRSSENPVWEEWVISFCFGGNDKNLGEGFSCGHQYKWTDSSFWLANVFINNVNTINTGERNPLEIWESVSLKLIVKDLGGNCQYICLPFCWSWPEGWGNFQQRGDSWKWWDWFWETGRDWEGACRKLLSLVKLHQIKGFGYEK